MTARESFDSSVIRVVAASAALISASSPPTMSATWATVISIIGSASMHSARRSVRPGRRGRWTSAVCPDSWPLPAMSTTSPGRASRPRDRWPRVDHRSRPPRRPMAPGPDRRPDQLRVLVRVVVDDDDQVRQFGGDPSLGSRLPASRSTPTPNTTASRPSGSARAGWSAPPGADHGAVVHQGREVLPGVDRHQPARHREQTCPGAAVLLGAIDGIQQRNVQRPRSMLPATVRCMHCASKRWNRCSASSKRCTGFPAVLAAWGGQVSGEWTLVCLAWNLKRMAVLRLKIGDEQKTGIVRKTGQRNRLVSGKSRCSICLRGSSPTGC